MACRLYCMTAGSLSGADVKSTYEGAANHTRAERRYCTHPHTDHVIKAKLGLSLYMCQCSLAATCIVMRTPLLRDIPLGQFALQTAGSKT